MGSAGNHFNIYIVIHIFLLIVYISLTIAGGILESWGTSDISICLLTAGIAGFGTVAMLLGILYHIWIGPLFCNCYSNCYNYNLSYRRKLSLFWSSVLIMYTMGLIVTFIVGAIINTNNRLIIKLVLGSGISLLHVFISGISGFLLGEYAFKEAEENIKKNLEARVESCVKFPPNQSYII
jgi:hypothetical protein